MGVCDRQTLSPGGFYRGNIKEVARLGHLDTRECSHGTLSHVCHVWAYEPSNERGKCGNKRLLCCILCLVCCPNVIPRGILTCRQCSYLHVLFGPVYSVLEQKKVEFRASRCISCIVCCSNVIPCGILTCAVGSVQIVPSPPM